MFSVTAGRKQGVEHLKGALMLVLAVLLLLPIALRIHQRACHQHQETGCLWADMYLSDYRPPKDTVGRPSTVCQET